MLLKGYDMAREIRRLKPSVREIAAEVEGYRHRATGKSPHGLCVESMFYLAMGATQLSYAIICAASEPMQWYADNYFKSLSAWRPFYEQYVAFNRGTEPGGIDPYIGPDHALRDTEAGEPSFAWSVAGSGDMIYDMATLGLPFCPDGNHSSALIMDASAVQGLARDEAARLFGTRGILLDRAAWEQARQRRLDTLLTDVPVPDGLAGVECMISGNGGRTAVVPSFSADVNNAGRLNLLRIADWLSDGKLPAIMETMAQAAVVPRIDSAQNLRSVMLLNCSISKQDSIRLRLRGCPPEAKRTFVWKKAGQPDEILRPRYEGTDAVVRIPARRLECRLAGRRIASRPRPKRIIEKPDRFSGELGYLCGRFLPTQHPDDEIPSRDSALRRTDGGMFRGDASRRGLAEPEDHDLQSSLRRESFAGGARRSDPRAAARSWSLFRRSTAAPGGRASSASTTKTS